MIKRLLTYYADIIFSGVIISNRLLKKRDSIWEKIECLFNYSWILLLLLVCPFRIPFFILARIYNQPLSDSKRDTFFVIMIIISLFSSFLMMRSKVYETTINNLKDLPEKDLKKIRKNKFLKLILTVIIPLMMCLLIIPSIIQCFY